MTQPLFRIAILVPQPVPPVKGGAENLSAGLLSSFNQLPGVQADLIALPSPERNLVEVLQSYAQFAAKNFDDYDQVLSMKYPAWAVLHRNHVVYLLHTLRGLYDTYPRDLPMVLSAKELQACRRRLGLPTALAEALLLASQSAWVGSDRAQAEALVLDQYGSLQQLLQDLLRGLQQTLSKTEDPLLASLHGFPGPFARACVRLLDAVALSPRAVQRYATISRTVATRQDYFPPGGQVQVIYPPSCTGSSNGWLSNHKESRDLIVTASRLDPPKRLDLLIRAYALSGVSQPFWIVGTGPAQNQLNALAQQTPGVSLKGYLSEPDLVEAYRRAVFVPFVPYQEDYGLVTVEAFMAEAPVLTTTDAGGPTELVVNGQTGWVAQPTAESIAEGFRALADPAAADRLRRMGKACRNWAEGLSWSELAQQLVHRSAGSAMGRPSFVRTRSRHRLLVINSFAVAEAASGGHLRIQGLYSALSRYVDIHLLDLGHPQTAHTLRQHCPGFIEETLPMPNELCKLEFEYIGQLGVSCLDLLVALRPELLTEFSAAMARCLDDCDLVVFSHPYCFPVYERLLAQRPEFARPIVYDAFNLESDLKADMYRSCAVGQKMLTEAASHAVLALEVRLLKAAQWVVACSDQDQVGLQRIATKYGLGQKTIAVANNGLNIQEAEWQPWEVRQHRMSTSEIAIALFMASGHAPNQQASQAIVQAARILSRREPDSVWRFVILGSVGYYLDPADLPDNVHVAGVVSVEEKTCWLARATVGLNPIVAGSGTNLKMVEYAAWGIPILSTPFGARGGIWTDSHFTAINANEDQHLADRLVEALDRFLTLKQEHLQRQVTLARAISVEYFDWSTSALHFFQALKRPPAQAC